MTRNSRFGDRNSELPQRTAVSRELRITDYGLRRLSRVLRIVLETFREIFDENAYARFLHLHRLEPSRDSYNRFLRDHSRRRERRPRCC